MPKRGSLLTSFLGALLLACLFLTPLAAQTPEEFNPDALALQLEKIETGAAAENVTLADLDEAAASLQTMKTTLSGQIGRLRQELTPLQERLDRLSKSAEEGAEPPPGLAEDRQRLQREIGAKNAQLVRGEDIDFRINGLLERIANEKREQFTQRLTTRGPTLFEVSVWLRGTENLWRKVSQVQAETTQRLGSLTMDGSRAGRLIVGALAVFVAIYLLYRLRHWAISSLTRRLTPDQELRHRTSISVGVILARLILPAASLLLAAIWIVNTGLFGPLGLALILGLGDAVLTVIGAYGLSAAFFSPSTPALRISRFGDKDAGKAHRRIVSLAVIVGLDFALVESGENDLGFSLEALILLNTALIAIGGVLLWRVADVLRPASSDRLNSPATGDEDGPAEWTVLPQILNFWRWLVRITAILAPILAFLGYYFGSRYAFYPLVFSGAVMGLGVLIFYMISDGMEEVVSGRSDSPDTVDLRLITVVLGFSLFCAALPILALIWGASVTDLSVWWQIIQDGFAVGEIKLSPIDVVGFVLVFSAGYLLTKMIQGVLTRNVLPLTRLDTGGKDAITAGVGYIGVIVSALIAISMIGVDLSNLAIVAGALSVGIGFGLQNIVNNFVSGIILLIERPIKAGDWVELSSGMGYVKKVNVRSTEVETFDRSTLFVPNSELISSSVINWTHSNMNGRCIVSVGVAYGSEPRKVEKILQEIADAHPMMLKRPAPYVLFRGFGSDSLDFEIRGVLRDVNWILNVQSDINFEISRRFEEAGIEIPFAQRDVTIKNISELGEGIARVAGESARGAIVKAKEEPAPETPPAPPSAIPSRPAGFDLGGDGDGDGGADR